MLDNEPGRLLIGLDGGVSVGEKGSTLSGMLSETGRVLAGTH